MRVCACGMGSVTRRNARAVSRHFTMDSFRHGLELIISCLLWDDPRRGQRPACPYLCRLLLSMHVRLWLRASILYAVTTQSVSARHVAATPVQPVHSAVPVPHANMQQQLCSCVQPWTTSRRRRARRPAHRRRPHVPRSSCSIARRAMHTPVPPGDCTLIMNSESCSKGIPGGLYSVDYR